MICTSQKSSSRGRFSTTVIFTPSAANIDAYSIPITPAPTTTPEAGISSSLSRPSESRIVRSSNATAGGRAGRVPDGDDDPLGGDGSLGARRDRDGVRVDEARAPGNDLDVVAQQLVPHDVDLALDHLLGANAQILHRDHFLHAVAVAVRRPLGHAGEVDDHLTEGLRRDRPPVDRDAAELAPLDEPYAASELRPLDRGLLSGRAGTDDEELVVERHRRTISAATTSGVGVSSMLVEPELGGRGSARSYPL